MEYKKLTIDWNAHPNDPKVELSVEGRDLSVTFFLNPYKFDVGSDFNGEVVFKDCYKYSFNSCNDEGYFHGQYRYKHDALPWGEFYELLHDWERDFHDDFQILNVDADMKSLRHFIFFFRDNTLECIAKGFEFKKLPG